VPSSISNRYALSIGTHGSSAPSAATIRFHLEQRAGEKKINEPQPLRDRLCSFVDDIRLVPFAIRCCRRREMDSAETT